MTLPEEVLNLGDNKEMLARLVRVFERGNGVTPFVGAGLSFGYGFPLWRNFLLDLASKAASPDFVHRIENRLDSGQYEEAAEDLETELTPDRFRFLFESRFGSSTLEKADLTAGAATVLPSLALGPVVTTNFDNVLERIFERAQRPFEAEPLWGHRIGTKFADYAHERQRLLIKLHGDVDDPHDRVLTLSEYRRHYGTTDENDFDRDAPLPRILLHLLSFRPALFVGCSLAKDRTVHVVNELARTIPDSGILQYAILEAPPTREELIERQTELLSRKVGTIWFPPGAYDLIEVILQHLAASIPPQLRPAVAARTTASVPTNLRYPAKGFVGREDHVRDLTDLMRGDRFATLLGPPGSGKTMLAVRVGRELLAHFEDGVFFVSLSSLVDAEEIPGHIADAIDGQEQAEKPPLNALVAKLRDRHCLLILDRCEHLVTAVGDVVSELLRRTERVSILATSRELLRRQGETKRRVGPMSLPPTDTATLAELEEYEASRLFLNRIDDSGRREGLTDDDAPLIAEICRKLDGIPLAIELAAGRMHHDTLHRVHAGLRDRFSYLRSRIRDRSPRHRTLTAAVAWSYEPLPDELKRLLLAVSVFQGGWAEEAAVAVSSDAGVDADRVRENLWELFDRSIVDRAQEDGRYSMLGTLRAYAEAHLRRLGEADAAHVRHGRYILQLVETGAPRLVLNAEKPGWITRLDREQANVRVAIRRACERGDVEMALRLGASYWRVWELRGYLHEGRRVLGELLANVGGQGHERFRARVLSGLSILAYRQGDMGQALAHARDAHELEVALDPADPARVAECLNDIGIAAQQLGRLEEAAEAYAESARLFGEVVGELQSGGPPDREALASAVRQEAIARYNGGNMEYMRGALEAARATLSRAVEDFERIGMETELGFPLTALGRTLTELGAFDDAGAALKRALRIRERLDIKNGQADSLHALGRLYLARGDLSTAAAALRKGLRIQRDIDDRKGVALSLESLGLLAVADGDTARAARLFAVADRLLAELNLPVRPVDRAALEAGHDAVRRAGHSAPDGGSEVLLEEAMDLALDEGATPARPGAWP